jgi:hypothetical protein
MAVNTHTAAIMNERLASPDAIGWFAHSPAEKMIATSLKTKRQMAVNEPFVRVAIRTSHAL